MAQDSTKKSYRVTLLGPITEHRVLPRVNGWLAANHFVVSNSAWLSPLEKKNSDSRCIELIVCAVNNATREIEQRNMVALRSDLPAIATELGIDIVVQENTPRLADKRLAVFDMDSTLIKAEVIDELAVEMGIGTQVAAITRQAMRGEIDFYESFCQRLALLKGLDASAFRRHPS